MDDFDAPETPDEAQDTRRLIDGLRRFPLGGQMRSGERAAPLFEPCCANERRGMSGGCINCGDPCL